MKETRRLMAIIVVFLFVQAKAQDFGFAFEHYTVLNGLPDNITTAVIQDKNGFIWIGTNQGLSRFDGKVFKNFTHLGQNGLSDLNVYAIAEDAKGAIWIGTQNGLNRLDPLTDSITQYYMGSGPRTIPYKWCNSLYVDREKTLWLSTEKGIACYNAKTDCFKNYPIQVFGNDAKINKFIAKIYEDKKGRFWLATSYGLVQFGKNTKLSKTFLYNKDKLNPSAFPVLSVAEDAKGSIWAGTWYDGLLKVDEANGCLRVETLADKDFKHYVISDMVSINLNGEENLFFATDFGLVQANLVTNTLSLHSFPEGGLGSFYVDRQGNIWITGGKGLYKMNLNGLAYKWLNLPKGVENPMVYHIIPDQRNPETAFYLSTLKGWWYFDKKNNTIIPCQLPFDPNKLLPAINQWVADSSGYWFTSMNGMGYYNTKSNTLKPFITEKFNNASYNYTQSIVKDRQGRLWIGVQRTGILVFDNNMGCSKLLFSDPDHAGSISGSDIRDMILGPDGFIYFLANYGMYRVSTSNFSYRFCRFPDSLSKVDKEKISPDNFCLTSDNRLLVSSKLRIYEYKNGVFTLRYPAKGYSDFMIEKIYHTSSGLFWLKTSKGIFKTNEHFTKWINLNDRLGWSDDVSVSDILFCKDGTIVLASKGKIGLLNDSILKPSPVPPKVLISKLVYGSRTVYLPSETEEGVVLAYNESIGIELAAVNFLHQKETKVYYQLQGLNAEINELTSQNIVTYQQLPSGKYAFVVWQQNSEGVKSQLSSIKITVKPPFYQTVWFLVSVLLWIAGIVYLIFRYRMKKALELERLRTRIATDLHDDIGATLSAISLYAEALKTQIGTTQPNLLNILSKISISSREMVGSMGDIVWAINPDNDFGHRMIERMHNYAADMSQAKDIVLRFESDQSLNALRFSLEFRKNIYLIFKEAMNNAAKYSKAKTIDVTLQLNGNLIRMVVRDNGEGFDEALIRHGNGIKNMFSRAKAIGASFELSSAVGEGTVISLTWGKHP